MMRLALEEARQALRLGEVPIGAVVANGQKVVASGFNRLIQSVDPTGHAEIIAIRKAAREVGNYRLGPLTLYVTVEPCMMCVGAILQARIGALVYGAPEPKFGAVASLFNLQEIKTSHRFSIETGVMEKECKKILKDFFQQRRHLNV